MKSRWSTPGEAHAYESGYIEGREDAQQWFLDTNLGDTVGRQKAIDTIMEEPSEIRYPVFYAEKIRQLPSAQPEIIRCKECKNHNLCAIEDEARDETFFCKWGERRN